MGCATVETRQQLDNQPGLAYFLPKQLTKVTVKRTLAEKDKLIKKLTAAKIANDKAKTALTAATNAVNTTKATIKAFKAEENIPQSEKTKLVAKLATEEEAEKAAQVAFDMKKVELEAATAALDRFIAAEALYISYASATEAQSIAEEQLRKISNDIKVSKHNLTSADFSESAKKTIRYQLDKQLFEQAEVKSNLDNKNEELDKKREAYEKAIGERTNSEDKGIKKRYLVDLKFEQRPLTADTSQAYYLNPQHRWTRDDTHKITVNEKGLLSSVNIVASDRTGDALAELAVFVGATTSGLGNILGGGNKDLDDEENAEDIDPCVVRPDEITILIDFSNTEAISSLNEELVCFGLKISKEAETSTKVNRKIPQSKYKIFKKSAWNGILYRTPVDVLVRVSQCTIGTKCNPKEDTGWVTTKMVEHSLPQAGPISFVPQNSGFLTKTTYDSVLKDGVLTKYDANRPSEILEVAKVPMKIVNGLADGISQILSIRIGQNKKLTELTTSELDLLKAELGLEAGENTALAGIETSRLELLRARLGLISGENDALADVANSESRLLESQYGLQRGEIDGRASIIASELLLLQAELGILAGENNARVSIAESELALYEAQIGALAGQNSAYVTLSESEVARLRAQASIATAQREISIQDFQSRLSALIATTQTQSRYDLIQACISQQISNGNPVIECVETP